MTTSSTDGFKQRLGDALAFLQRDYGVLGAISAAGLICFAADSYATPIVSEWKKINTKLEADKSVLFQNSFGTLARLRNAHSQQPSACRQACGRVPERLPKPKFRLQMPEFRLQ